jgi:hypothetical protein
VHIVSEHNHIIKTSPKLALFIYIASQYFYSTCSQSLLNKPPMALRQTAIETIFG